MQVLDKEINDEISEFVTIKKLVEWLNTKNGGKCRSTGSKDVTQNKKGFNAPPIILTTQ